MFIQQKAKYCLRAIQKQFPHSLLISKLSLLRQPALRLTRTLFVFFDFILYSNVRNLYFHDFSWFSETSGMVSELFCKNDPESLYRGYKGTIPPMVTWYVSNFGHLTKSTFQCKFKCKTYLARYDHRYLICKESSYTMTLYEKTDLTPALRFLRKNKKSPIKSPFLVVPYIKFVWYVCFDAQIKFCCESD